MGERVLICGSRSWPDWNAIRQRVLELPNTAVVIHGAAEGADKMAGWSAQANGLWVIEVPCKQVHWRRYGNSAGHKRNAIMLDLKPDRVIAFQRDGSSGTQGTIDEARRRGIPVEVHGLGSVPSGFDSDGKPDG